MESKYQKPSCTYPQTLIVMIIMAEILLPRNADVVVVVVVVFVVGDVAFIVVMWLSLSSFLLRRPSLSSSLSLSLTSLLLLTSLSSSLPLLSLSSLWSLPLSSSSLSSSSLSSSSLSSSSSSLSSCEISHLDASVGASRIHHLHCTTVDGFVELS